MNQIRLPHTGRFTTQLGFGCSSLMGAIGRRESLTLLESAFHAGIRHFDVAPMYGYGAAENCLGEFLSRHPGEITVTTKFGIPPPSNQRLIRAARRTLNPFLKRLPGLRQRISQTANTVVDLAPAIPLTAKNARASLDRSLSELRTDRIDLLLLHEARVQDLQDDALLTFLQDAVATGKIGAFGCGSTAARIPALLVEKPEYCPVLQFEWSVLDQPVDSGSAFTVHHRALTANFAALRTALADDQARNRRWSQAVGLDLAQPGALAALMLKAALVFNPDSLILVSSRSPKHIQDNVRVAGDASLIEPARKLYDLAQRERAHVTALR